MSTTADYRKHFFALGFRSIRRVAANASAEVDDTEVRVEMLKELSRGGGLAEGDCPNRLAAQRPHH